MNNNNILNQKNPINKKDKILITILVILIILSLLLIILVVYNNHILKETENEKQNSNQQEVIKYYPINFLQPHVNTTLPGSYVDIYFKVINEDDNSLIFGKIIENVKVLNVKDDKDQDVFEKNSNDVRKPAYILYSITKEQELLLRKILYLQNSYNIELLILPCEEDTNNIITNTTKEINEFVDSKIENNSILPYIQNLDEGVLKTQV